MIPLTSIITAGVFYLLPFADLSTGILLSLHISSEGGLSSPSQLARMLVLTLLATRLSRPQLGLVALEICLAMMAEFMGAVYHQSGYGLGIGFANTFKLAYITTTSLVFWGWVSKNEITAEGLVNHALNSGFIYASNVVLALIFGFGEKTYGDGTFGTKGFVPSNNGLSMTLGALLVLSTITPPTPWSRIRNIVLLLGTLFIGAKASIAFCAVYLFILFIRARPWNKVMSALVISSVLCFQFNRIIQLFWTIFDVILFRYKLNEGSFFKFIASGRDNYITCALGNIGPDIRSSFRLITGMGALVSFRDLDKLNLLHPIPGAQIVYETLETDFFDLMFQYGIFSAITYLAIIILIAFRLSHLHRPIHLLTWGLVSAFSLLAGHVVFNGMSALVVALLIGCTATPPSFFNQRASDAAP